MTTDFAPRQASPGQRLSFADTSGALHVLAAEEVQEGRFVLQPQSALEEAAAKRRGLSVDREWQATLKEARQGKLTGDALDARGHELEIEGFDVMKADDKRAAIAALEAENQANDQDGAGAPSEEN